MSSDDLEKLAQQAENEQKTEAREGELIQRKQQEQDEAEQTKAALETGLVIVGMTFGAIEFLYRDIGLEIPDKDKQGEAGAKAWAAVLIKYGITYGDEATYPEWLKKMIAWGKEYMPILMLIYWNADLFWSMRKLAMMKAEEIAQAEQQTEQPGGDGGQEPRPVTT